MKPDWLWEIEWWEFKWRTKRRFKAIFVYPVTEFVDWIIKSLQYAWFLRPGQDYDWDFAYILRLLRYKLIRTAKRIKKNNIIEDAQKVHDEIMETVVLMDECTDRAEYICPELGELFMKSSPIRGEGEKLTPEEEARVSELIDESERQRTEDWNRLFDTLKEKMPGWWD